MTYKQELKKLIKNCILEAFKENKILLFENSQTTNIEDSVQIGSDIYEFTADVSFSVSTNREPHGENYSDVSINAIDITNINPWPNEVKEKEVVSAIKQYILDEYDRWNLVK